MFRFLIIALYFTIAVSSDYSPVKDLDLTQYAGRWYQVYLNKFDTTFQGDCSCAVADYTLSGSTVDILNSQINKDGSVGQIAGSAFYKQGNVGGELSVSLDGVPRVAPYWVIEIGPLLNNLYAYSIVSDDKKLSLFVLTRNVTEYYETYDDEVLKSLSNFGFTNIFNKPKTVSQVNCDYGRYDTGYQGFKTQDPL